MHALWPPYSGTYQYSCYYISSRSNQFIHKAELLGLLLQGRVRKTSIASYTQFPCWVKPNQKPWRLLFLHLARLPLSVGISAVRRHSRLQWALPSPAQQPPLTPQADRSSPRLATAARPLPAPPSAL